jgi:hypothetical protein
VNAGAAIHSQIQAPAPVGEVEQAAGYESLRQEFAQLAANEQLPPAAPVKAEQGGVAILPAAVDFKAGKNVFVLVFRDDGGTMATLALEEVQLRQWLQLLYKCAEREGGWQLTMWPAWLAGTSFTKAPQGLSVH